MATETPKAQDKLTAEQIAALIDEGVKAGDIEAVDDKITTKVKGQDGKDVEHSRAYRKLTAKTLKGASILSERSEKALLSYFNYAFDLGVRSRERNALLATLEGPEKAIDKAAKALVAAGLYAQESEARAFVVAQRQAAGLPV